MYDPRVVKRAVRLVRDLFDNLVSRLHHEQKENPKRGRERFAARYPNDTVGLKRWCSDDDAVSESAGDERRADWAGHGYPPDITDRFIGVSCYAKFVRYAHWHLMSIRVVEVVLEIPVLCVHYEDYGVHGVGNVTDRMLDFLGLDRVGRRLPNFHENKDYSQYFTREERASVQRLVASRGDRIVPPLGGRGRRARVVGQLLRDLRHQLLLLPPPVESRI